MEQLNLFSSPGSKKLLLQEEVKKSADQTKAIEIKNNAKIIDLSDASTIIFSKDENNVLSNNSSEISSVKKNIKNTQRGRKNIQETENNIVNIPADEILFQKQYYSISEVADMFSVNNSLIRFWENEFDIVQPRKNRKGDRFFSPIEIKKIELIYSLLRQRKFTIPGAKEYLKNYKKVEQQHSLIQSLQQIKSFLLELKATMQ